MKQTGFFEQSENGSEIINTKDSSHPLLVKEGKNCSQFLPIELFNHLEGYLNKDDIAVISTAFYDSFGEDREIIEGMAYEIPYMPLAERKEWVEEISNYYIDNEIYSNVTGLEDRNEDKNDYEELNVDSPSLEKWLQDVESLENEDISKSMQRASSFIIGTFTIGSLLGTLYYLLFSKQGGIVNLLAYMVIGIAGVLLLFFTATVLLMGLITISIIFCMLIYQLLVPISLLFKGDRVKIIRKKVVGWGAFFSPLKIPALFISRKNRKRWVSDWGADLQVLWQQRDLKGYFYNLSTMLPTAFKIGMRLRSRCKGIKEGCIEEKPSLSIQGLQVLATVLRGPSEGLSFMELFYRTKYSSFTLYPILAKFEVYDWLESYQITIMDRNDEGKDGESERVYRRRYYKLTKLGTKEFQEYIAGPIGWTPNSYTQLN